MNLWPLRSGLRVLMYHKLSENHCDGLTVTLNDFKRHIDKIKELHFQIISMKDLLTQYDQSEFWKKKTVLITFDDGYQNNADLLFPYVHENKIPVTVFLPVKWIGLENEWDHAHDPLMSFDTLKTWQKKSEYINFGLHSYAHENYKHLSAQNIQTDLNRCEDVLRTQGLSFEKVLAYPYGGFPKDNQRKADLVKTMNAFGMKAAFRIGNRINKKQPVNPFFIERIDVRGDESFERFVRKLKYGKLI